LKTKFITSIGKYSYLYTGETKAASGYLFK